ncbi:hypothetical protein HYS82_03870 [Candidatus Amesbacteria bacterium]|nr:hypothetical protein [Candidatus Amesbacteria bacterium]
MVHGSEFGKILEPGELPINYDVRRSADMWIGTGEGQKLVEFWEVYVVREGKTYSVKEVVRVDGNFLFFDLTGRGVRGSTVGDQRRAAAEKLLGCGVAIDGRV